TVLTARDADAYIWDMKAVYDKFRNRGVEIYQVCLDGNKLAWENLVKRYDIRWTCVWDPDGLQSKVARLWNIQSVPADYIINRKSEIVGKNLFGRRLEDRLNDLLK
ncbi:MAG: redoxin domain-containing protein, partial [Odoribacter sp.]|nr:redoxin domain-containing protein [Odoribacter sp.]